MNRKLSARTLVVAVTLAAAAAWPAAAVSQDAHYWTYGYGPIGQLTEGTLVGGVSDLSAVFYNPAACALIEEPSFVLTLNSIELARLDVPGAAGEGLDFDQLVFDVVPAMVAGHIGSHDNGGSHFALAFLGRHDSDYDLGYSTANVSAGRPDADAGYGRVRQRLVEYWVGGTWSRRVGSRISVGLSPFLAYRAQRRRRSLTAEDLSEGVSRAVFIGDEAEYNHVRVLAKLGLAYRPEPWEIGLTVTIPGAKLWGNGKAVFNASVAGEASAPYLAATRQKGLPATYHAPWSVAAGVTRRGRTTALHTTAEWFSSVGRYDIFKPDPAPVAGRAETIPLVYQGQAKSILNYGVGLEQHLFESVVLYAGAARNHSAYVPERDAFSAWDLTDLTVGLTFDRGRKRLALGLGYAWGRSEIPQVVVPPDAAAPPPPREARFSRWTISIGFSLNAE